MVAHRFCHTEDNAWLLAILNLFSFPHWVVTNSQRQIISHCLLEIDRLECLINILLAVLWDVLFLRAHPALVL